MLEFLKKYKLFIIVSFVAAAALIIAFITGGNPGDVKKQTISDATTTSATQSTTAATVEKEQKDIRKGTTVPESTAAAQTQPTEKSAGSGQESGSQTNKSGKSESSKKTSESSKASNQASRDKYRTNPVPEGKPEPVEPQEHTVADKKTTVTVSVSCSSVLDNMNKLDEDKRVIIPDNGWILKPVKAEINEGETVFDVTKRVCMENKIHMEFSFTPIYNSAYIEGIGNLYEFDCGSGSGWMYSVDSWFPNYGCSRYALKGGETIEWKYTTDIGYDIGGGHDQWNGG